MANTQQKELFPKAVIDGLNVQLRKLRMAEKRQAETLEETRASIKAIENIVEQNL